MALILKHNLGLDLEYHTWPRIESVWKMELVGSLANILFLLLILELQIEWEGECSNHIKHLLYVNLILFSWRFMW